jgi:energy-converting hydrogenase B subunit D
MEALTFISFIFDSLLAMLLLLVAGFTLFSRGLFRAIVLYIAFGLLLALSWARLDAPDIALAEIAIGAGLTGALLLSAWARLKRLNSKVGNESTSGYLRETQKPRPFSSTSNQSENQISNSE